jgi:hypothetical protein
MLRGHIMGKGLYSFKEPLAKETGLADDLQCVWRQSGVIITMITLQALYGRVKRRANLYYALASMGHGRTPQCPSKYLTLHIFDGYCRTFSPRWKLARVYLTA